jgi:hypothetical protein
MVVPAYDPVDQNTYKLPNSRKRMKTYISEDRNSNTKNASALHWEFFFTSYEYMGLFMLIRRDYS